MRSIALLTLCGIFFGMIGTQAFAQTTVNFHVKAHDQSCKTVLFEYQDTKKKSAKRVKAAIVNPSAKKGEFSSLLSVEVEPGHHHIAQITCKGKTASKDYALIHTFDKMLYSDPLPGFKRDEMHYDIAAGDTLYLGAFERINMGKFTARKTGAILDLSAPIVSDQSDLAIKDGKLLANGFSKSLIGVTFDVDRVLGRQDKLKAAGDLNFTLMDAMGLNKTAITMPASGGTGELALHYYNNNSCPAPKAYLTKVDENGDAENKKKLHKFKFKKAKVRAENPLYLDELPSGRYELTSLSCDNKLSAPKDLYAVFDVHPGETTYGGELFMDVRFAVKGQTFKLSTRERFQDAVASDEAKYKMVHRNGLTPAVFAAQSNGRINRAEAKVGKNRPYFQTYKDAQIEYADKLVLPTPKQKK